MVDGFGHGGIQQANLLLITEYIKIFGSVTLIVAKKNYGDLELPESVKFKVIDLKSSKFIDLKALYKLRKFFTINEPDFILANMYRSQIWSAALKTRSSKLIWVEQNTHFDRSVLKWFVMRIFSNRVNKIVCISDDVKKITISKLKKFGITITIPNPIRYIATPSLSKRVDKDFIFVGRLVPQKNPGLAIKSFAEFCKQYKADSVLHIVGDGELLEELKQLAWRLNIYDKCNFHGWLSNVDVQKLMSKCKTLISTSKIEGMALVRLEALAQGCCVISTESGGSRQYLRPEKNEGTFIVDPTPSSISQIMHLTLSEKYWTEELINKRINLTSELNPVKIAKDLISFSGE
jgi:glycosyltransferase involved in cell wall biosynthesis